MVVPVVIVVWCRNCYKHASVYAHAHSHTHARKHSHIPGTMWVSAYIPKILCQKHTLPQSSSYLATRALLGLKFALVHEHQPVMAEFNLPFTNHRSLIRLFNFFCSILSFKAVRYSSEL